MSSDGFAYRSFQDDSSVWLRSTIVSLSLASITCLCLVFIRLSENMVRFNLLCTNIDPIGSGKLFVLSTVTVNEGDESQMRLSYFKCLVFTHYRTPGTKPCFGVLNLFVCVQDGYLLVLSAVLITKEIMVFKNHAFQAKISGLQHWPSVLVRCIILCFCIMVLIFLLYWSHRFFVVSFRIWYMFAGLRFWWSRFSLSSVTLQGRYMYC